MGARIQAVIGPVLAVAGAALTVVSLFLSWYHVHLTGALLKIAQESHTNLSLTGFQANSSLDVLLIACAAGAVAGVVWAQLRDPAGGAIRVLLAGVAATALALGRLADPPSSTLHVRVGLPLAIAGGVVMAIAGLLMRGAHAD